MRAHVLEGGGLMALGGVTGGGGGGGGLPSAAGGAGGARDDEEGFALPPLAFALVLQASKPPTELEVAGADSWTGVVWSTRSAFAFSAVFRFLFISNLCCTVVCIPELDSGPWAVPDRAAVE
jgi:hypothetical protein